MTSSSRDTVLEKLTEVFRDVFDDEAMLLTRDTTAEEIEEWDSLNQIKLIIGCEKAFSIRLKPREINALQNIGEMVDHLVAHISNA
ncbi:MAG: acyl carrier protein [Rhodospirillaceae bacterium]|jgi:acyl carrier protein|nr:acyl carrier protein [Rhodospirillaceae bacterium]MBT5373699.1 acyl carrier protein [Rhodospirillaceae bacterium]MBT5658768.1 acyl carrier protein [Rhodospirillaceae bacterium]MBT5751488.1 acyl carrier protein [Rhodospirillaceae bacterium]